MMPAGQPLPGLPGGGERDALPLLARIGRTVRTGAHVVRILFLGRTVAAALGDGTVRFLTPGDAEPRVVDVHTGTILCAAATADRTGVLTGGDDGRLALTFPDGTTRCLTEAGRWVDAVVAAEGGRCAFAHGRTMTVLGPDGPLDEVAIPSSGPGLAVAPDGRMIAIAHLGGATMIDVTASGGRMNLSWKGAHIAATFSPDGRFLVTAMNENALHGWRLSNFGDIAMTGYASKPRSLSWSGNGLWLASSGSDGTILWPFKGKKGPMGQPATVISRRPTLVTAVACHPESDVVATGFRDGCVEIVRRSDDTAVPVRPGATPSSEMAVTDLAFDPVGRFLAFGTASGVLGVLGVLDFANGSA